jgi:outer membrane protein OmpA-like peptidoglycan-associated protein
MRRPIPSAPSRPLLALLLVLGVASPASAQTPPDPKALDQLGPAPARPPAGTAATPAPPPAKAATRKPDATKPAPPKTVATRPATPTPGKTPPAKTGTPPATSTAAAKPPPLVVPAAPPPMPILPPPIAVPTRAPPPPTPVPLADDAPGRVIAEPSGLRVTFGTDRADLSPASAGAIEDLVHRAPGGDSSFTVTAFAPGGDDPSTPRRLSLSRALAVRSALMQAGVASVRIYVRALGAAAPTIAEGPADRVDIVVTAGQTPAETTPAAAPASSRPPPSNKVDP